jgi:hypothetical protein
MGVIQDRNKKIKEAQDAALAVKKKKTKEALASAPLPEKLDDLKPMDPSLQRMIDAAGKKTMPKKGGEEPEPTPSPTPTPKPKRKDQKCEMTYEKPNQFFPKGRQVKVCHEEEE